ncbi:hypothetical protein KP509_1Z048400 [Ceratopteris richardii]|nr:hypothetical protein KP509_1Z048400 [Ceratopteris richardii]
MYGKCGRVDDARNIFYLLPHRDIFSWSSLINVLAKQGYGMEALDSFCRMMEEGVSPNRITFIGILSACAIKDDLSEGKRTHSRFETSEPKNDVVLETALVNLYGKCGKMKDAQNVFQKMVVRDNVAWNAIIAASTDQNQGMLALEFCRQMHEEGVTPDRVTFTSLIDACSNNRLLLIGKQFHQYLVEKGYELDTVLGTTIMTLYGRCGCLDDARRVFDQLPSQNLISWNALITAYAQHGLGSEAMQLFYLMQQSGFNADNITFISIFEAQSTLAEARHLHSCVVSQGLESDHLIGNALVNMYGKCNRTDDADYVFKNMPRCNVITWTSMIASYVEKGEYRKALQIFDKMHEQKVCPDKVTFICGLTACTGQMALVEGKQMHQYIIDSGIEIDIDLGNALITMYAKCGKIATSERLFEHMLDRDIITWNAVVTGFAQHGMGKEAFSLFERMLNGGLLIPNKVTLVGILTACSHAGLIEVGQCCFMAADDYKGVTIEIDHHECMADLLGRSGCLAEAEALVSEMPFQPTPLSFLVLLGACKYLAPVQLGELIAKQIFELNPDDPSPYIILSNIYVDSGIDIDEADIPCSESILNSVECTNHQINVSVEGSFGASGFSSFPEEDMMYAEV